MEHHNFLDFSIEMKAEIYKLKNEFMTNRRKMKPAKNIAFVMNENKRSELIEWSYFNKELLLPHEIIAIGPAGKILEGTLNKKVNKLVSGPLGGYRQLSDMIVEGKADTVIFFGTIDEVRMHSNELSALMETALTNNIIVAVNRTTADFVLTSFLMNKDYSIEVEELQEQQKNEQGKIKKLANVA
jgi:methylglyoxal synthase